MALLIDCYNVLHEREKPPALAGLDEASLCSALARGSFASQRSVIVCDGNPKPQGLTGSPVDGVRLVYSGRRRTADDVIISMINADSAPRRLIVVSSDRAIRKAARRRRAASWTSAHFLSQLAAAMGVAAPTSSKPTDELSESQVQHWLEQFGIDEVQDDGEEDLWPPRL